MTTDRKHPQNVAELMERYAAGERDFRGAQWFGADLRGVALDDVNLNGADLGQSLLDGVSLSRAKLIHASLNGANAREATFDGADLSGVDLVRATIDDARFNGATLRGAVLNGANVHRTNFDEAILEDADFSFAQLVGAKLRRTSLRRANFVSTDLSHASLVNAELAGADFTNAKLTGASFGGAVIAQNFFLDVDLSPLCDAEPPVGHHGESTIDLRSILRSVHSPGLKDFLQRTGMPEVFVEYMVSCALSLQTDTFKLLRSTYLIFGQPDEPFARKLYESLHRNGVTTFFFPEHSVPGKRLHRAMHEGIAGHDRMVLICSRDSLDRDGVQFELDQTLAREAREKKSEYLLPVVLDDYLFDGWNPPSATHLHAVRERIAADFRGADRDPDRFDAGLLKLIAALKK